MWHKNRDTERNKTPRILVLYIDISTFEETDNSLEQHNLQKLSSKDIQRDNFVEHKIWMLSKNT
jgi:hypothetical protein